MKEKNNIDISDDEIISAYNKTAEGDLAEPDGSEPEKTSDSGKEAVGGQKKKKHGIERHLYPCPHCGEQILDHFTKCPKCGGEVTPRGYHVDEEKRKKVVRVFEIVGAVISVGLVILLAILLNR